MSLIPMFMPPDAALPARLAAPQRRQGDEMGSAPDSSEFGRYLALPGDSEPILPEVALSAVAPAAGHTAPPQDEDEDLPERPDSALLPAALPVVLPVANADRAAPGRVSDGPALPPVQTTGNIMAAPVAMPISAAAPDVVTGQGGERAFLTGDGDEPELPPVAPARPAPTVTAVSADAVRAAPELLRPQGGSADTVQDQATGQSVPPVGGPAPGGAGDGQKGADAQAGGTRGQPPVGSPVIPDTGMQGGGPTPWLASASAALMMAPSALPAQAVLARHVATQIGQVAITSGEHGTDIRLQPEELGRLRLALQVDGATISVVIAAERPETVDLMRRHIDMLAQEFRQLGFRDVGFSFEGWQGSGGGAQDLSRHSAQAARGAVASAEHEPAPDMPPASATTLRATPSGGLDLRL